MLIRKLEVLAILIIALAGMSIASNYMYEKSSVKGTGYKNDEKIISSQTGFNVTKNAMEPSFPATFDPETGDFGPFGPACDLG